MHIMKPRPESVSETPFRPFKVDDEQDFEVVVDRALKNIIPVALHRITEDRRGNNTNGKHRKLLQFPGAPYYRDSGMTDARRYTTRSE